MIRITREDDTEALLAIATGTAVFKPIEIEALQGVLDEYHETNHELQHRAITYELDGKPVGFAYYAPIEMTDRTWTLYWICVDKSIHAKGIGTKLLHYAEQDIASMNGRIFLIETSHLPSYEPTRKFYSKHGYDLEGTIRDYYSEGDNMVIFRKQLQSK
ncbi:MAG: GNAT family N-acetyltransferase [Gemmataceae bacterium]